MTRLKTVNQFFFIGLSSPLADGVHVKTMNWVTSTNYKLSEMLDLDIFAFLWVRSFSFHLLYFIK